MWCFEDHHHFLAISGSLIATVAYFTPCVSHRVWWVKMLVASIVAQLGYASLAAWLPDTFGYNLVSAMGTMFLLGCGFLILVRVVFEVAMLASIMLLLGPILMHNIALLTKWLRANVSPDIPPWIGVAMFVAVFVLVAVVVWKCRVVPLLLVSAYVVASSLTLWVYTKMAIIESNGSTAICCEWSTPPDVSVVDDTGAPTNETTQAVVDHSLCPISLDNYQHNMILAGLFMLAAVMSCAWQTRHCKSRYQPVEKEDPGAKPTKVKPPHTHTP